MTDRTTEAVTDAELMALSCQTSGSTRRALEDLQRLRKEERQWRRMLAFAYSGSQNLYGDDGELQDSRLPWMIDYVRDPLDQIQQAIWNRGNLILESEIKKHGSFEAALAARSAPEPREQPLELFQYNDDFTSKYVPTDEEIRDARDWLSPVYYHAGLDKADGDDAREAIENACDTLNDILVSRRSGLTKAPRPYGVGKCGCGLDEPCCDSCLPPSQSSTTKRDCQHDLLQADTTVIADGRWDAKCSTCGEEWHIPHPEAK